MARTAAGVTRHPAPIHALPPATRAHIEHLVAELRGESA